MSYHYKRIRVNGYTRHKPRTKRVQSYKRNQRFGSQTKITRFVKPKKKRIVKTEKITPIEEIDGFPLEDFDKPPEKIPEIPLKKSIPEKTSPEFDYYFGTASPETFNIIDKHDKKDKLGVCINMYRYDKNLLKRLKRLEELNLDVFVDNGSFERFGKMLKQKITPEEYLDKDACNRFFERITKNYEKLLEESKKPQNIMLTIPEVIGSQELTQELQLKYIDTYKKFQEKYKCKLITSLQFNAKGSDWFKELEEGSDFIQKHIPKKWIIGIPFGNDFKVISDPRSKKARENFAKVRKVFKTKLKGYQIHLFACGSPTKLEQFAIPSEDIIYSVDASTLMHMSKDSHYFNKNKGRVIDIRYLTGKMGKPETIAKKRKEFEEASGIPYEKWILSPRMHPQEAIKYLRKFDINTDNFTSYYKFK